METLTATPILRTTPRRRVTSFVVPSTPKGSRNYNSFLKAMNQIREACKDNTKYSF